jgi:hypothetical protein
MSLTFEGKVEFVKKHYEEKGYRVHSGLQFGAELVLYADRPDLVHSDFCIHVTRDGKYTTEIDRVLGSICSCLFLKTAHHPHEIACFVSRLPSLSPPDELIDWREMQTLVRSMPDLHKTLVLANVKGVGEDDMYVEELAITTEHAPFRHRPKSIEIGAQRKTQSKKHKLKK